MDSITKFITESLNLTSAIIIALVVVIIFLIYRNWNSAKKSPPGRPSDEIPPSADELLDKLEKSGAVIKPESV